MPNLYLDINEERAAAKGVAFGDIVNTLNVQYGGSYINDFTKGGRNYRVMLQAEADSRQQIDDLSNLYVRSSQGEMVRLSNLVAVRTVLYPSSLVRYNVSGSTTINGITMPGYSSGQAIAAAKLRFRAVLMTAFSFILGVVPLMLASSAGAAAMQAIGMASFGGMLAATVLGCLFVPAFFVLFQTLRERFSCRKQPEPELLIATFPASND